MLENKAFIYREKRNFAPEKEIFTMKKVYKDGSIKYFKLKVNPNQVGKKKRTKEEEEKKKINDNILRSQRRIKSTISDYIKSNDFKYFLTLTDREQLKDLQQAKTRMQNWLSNIRKRYYPNLMYIVIPELHKSGAIHWHGVMSECICKDLVTANYSVMRYKGKNKLYNLTTWRFGFSSVNEIEHIGKLSNYITKYITKDIIYMEGKQSYLVSQGLDLPFLEYGNYKVDIEATDLYYSNDIFCSYESRVL